MHRFLVTGGAGFIGSAVVRHIIEHTDDEVCVVDKLTYAEEYENLAWENGCSVAPFVGEKLRKVVFSNEHGL